MKIDNEILRDISGRIMGLEILRKYLKLKQAANHETLIILDDVYPHLLTGFRIAEFNYYLKMFKNCMIYSSTPHFAKFKNEYVDQFPEFKDKIMPFNPDQRIFGSLFYTVFLHNIYSFLPIIEREKVPFVFTLYPGGSFWLDNPESDRKLKKALSSRFMKKVIVTQKITYNYLVEKKFCSPDNIEFIYGGVNPSDYFSEKFVEKKFYQKDKDTFDICFVAVKYMERGVDKGYDIFVECARRLSSVSKGFRFHVVGGFDENEVAITDIRDRFTFYGYRYRDFFPEFYSRMDIFLSPNVPNKLHPGKFDGFPTGAAIEAGLAGVAVFCTDELKLNLEFTDRHDIYIISRNIDDITDSILMYFKDLNSLYRLSANGRKRFSQVFDIDRQMKKRVAILHQHLNDGN